MCDYFLYCFVLLQVICFGTVERYRLWITYVPFVVCNRGETAKAGRWTCSGCDTRECTSALLLHFSHVEKFGLFVYSRLNRRIPSISNRGVAVLDGDHEHQRVPGTFQRQRRAPVPPSPPPARARPRARAGQPVCGLQQVRREDAGWSSADGPPRHEREELEGVSCLRPVWPQRHGHGR